MGLAGLAGLAGLDESAVGGPGGSAFGSESGVVGGMLSDLPELPPTPIWLEPSSWELALRFAEPQAAKAPEVMIIQIR